MPPKHGNQEFYDNTEKCTAETILADLPTSGPFTLIFRSQCMVYLLEDLPACYPGSSQKVSFFLDFLFVLFLLRPETPPIRGGLDNPACHTNPPKHHLSFLLAPLPSQNQESLLLAKCRSPSNVFARFRLSRRHIFLQVPEPEVLIFAREPL